MSEVTTITVPAEFAGWTAQQLLMRQIILLAIKWGSIAAEEIQRETVAARFEELDAAGLLDDLAEEVRCDGFVTDLPAPYSRNYASEMRAAAMDGGVWVAWPFYSGGGKHGQPQSMPWLADAKVVEVTLEPVTVTKRTFKVVA